VLVVAAFQFRDPMVFVVETVADNSSIHATILAARLRGSNMPIKRKLGLGTLAQAEQGAGSNGAIGGPSPKRAPRSLSSDAASSAPGLRFPSRWPRIGPGYIAMETAR
jgi:hypothetical protein